MPAEIFCGRDIKLKRSVYSLLGCWEETVAELVAYGEIENTAVIFWLKPAATAEASVDKSEHIIIRRLQSVTTRGPGGLVV